MTYPKTEPKANFPELEHQVLSFWRKNKIFHKSLEQTKNGAPFTFYDGPPFGNGLPHWGHLGVSAIKDMVSRYQTMSGKHVVRELGWDCHGLPAENSVEKATGRAAKDIVADEGMATFCDMCRVDVQTYVKEWERFIERIGRWVDIGADKGYRTMDLDYMESMLWTVKELHERGLLYKDYRVNPFDWKMGTVLSNSEASSDYREVVDDAITVWFELASGRRILAWTTTPWTLPGNSALAVNPKLTYAVMKDEDGHEYIIAESRLAAYKKQFTKAAKACEIKGAELVGLSYKPLFDYYNDEKLYRVVAGDFVSDDSGTGIVHLAPAFGEDDFWALKEGDPEFPIIVNVDNYGNFDETVEDFVGMNIFEADPRITEKLKKAGNLVKKEQFKHSYPYGDRSKEKLIYRATESWYINVPKIKDRLLANNEQVWWTSAGERFRDWIANARPWSISRNRFWGVPLPIWVRGDEYKVFGSIAELEKFFGVKIDDLHRPTLDALTKDGWTRIPDVLDCWVESGAMPWASLHYPFNPSSHSGAEAGLPKNFPGDYIIEGQDQTRGWFYSLMVLATALFDKPAFKVVSANGMMVDEHKKKFSKSVGNFVNPEAQIEQFGADAVRLFILGSNFMKAEPVPMDMEGKVFVEPSKNILVPLWNAYHFFTLYANAGGVTATDNEQLTTGNSNILDQYVLAELDDLAGVVRGALDDYKPEVAIREFTRFLEVLNNWYVRLNRQRFWDEEQGAFDTLYFVLSKLCKLLAPFAPFVSEYVFRALTGKESVHLERFPAQGGMKIPELLTNMRRVQQVVATGKMLRENAGLRNRLPLAQLTIAAGACGNTHLQDFTGIIKDELNVKTVEFTSDISSVADSFVYLITPKIGARLGAGLKEIMAAAKQPGFNPADFGLLPDEFETRLTVKPGVTGAALSDNTAVIVLDTNITKELRLEGLARDALRFIQDSRKEAGLDVSDRIVLEYAADGELLAAIGVHAEMIKENALVTDLQAGAAAEFSTEIEGHKLGIKITKG
ncbi:MAG: isoleucine--tRNA ligase [Alphaproteobacteria bacterium]|nr:isoleucine--tRNA ligase [Alphaproteobacteria bacterium]MCL2757692.1 isoleucine--tRNA ligase [Alphaproteobacteria bacterium]